jgi:hypothetical protein
MVKEGDLASNTYSSKKVMLTIMKISVMLKGQVQTTTIGHTLDVKRTYLTCVYAI